MRGLHRVFEKDVVAYREEGQILPNRLRVKVRPDPAPDYYERMHNLEIPASYRSLPRSGVVTDVFHSDDEYRHLIGERVFFLGKKKPEAPDLIFKENNKTMFIYHIRKLV